MIRLVLTTFGDEDEAGRVACSLVEAGLAACATLLPGARSIYRWKGELQDAREVVVLFKLPSAGYESFLAAFLALHPYETPGMLAIDADAVGGDYLAWVMESCSLPTV